MLTRRTTLAYPLLLALGAIDAAGYSLMVPVAPAIADDTGAGPATIGVLVASFPAGMVAGLALAGGVVRRAGPRMLLCGSILLVAVGSLGFVLSDSLLVYFPARTLMGLGSGGIWIGVTFDTLDRCPGEEYRCMSRVFAAYSAGGLIGPALGALGGVHWPFLAYLVVLLLALPALLLIGDPPRRREFAGDRSALRIRAFWTSAAAVLFAVMTLGVLEGVLPLHFADRLTQAQIGGLYVGAAVIVAAGAAAAGRMAPRPLVVVAVLIGVAGTSLAGWSRASRSGSSHCCSRQPASGSPTQARSGC